MDAAKWLENSVRYENKHIYITLENYVQVKISVQAIVETLVKSSDTKIDDAIAAIVLGAL